MSPIPLSLPLALALAMPIPQETQTQTAPSSQADDADSPSSSSVQEVDESNPRTDVAVKTVCLVVSIVLLLALLVYLCSTIDLPSAVAAWWRRLTGRGGSVPSSYSSSSTSNSNRSGNKKGLGRSRGAGVRLGDDGLATASSASSPLSPLPPTTPPPEHGIRLTNAYSIRREERVVVMPVVMSSGEDVTEREPAPAVAGPHPTHHGNSSVSSNLNTSAGHSAFQFGFDSPAPLRSATTTPKQQRQFAGREGVKSPPPPPPPPPRALKTGTGAPAPV